jgi:dTDP-4-dehydrorhamnose reductase
MVAPIKEMTWAITGGSGQLARSLVYLLEKQGVKYRSWSRSDLDISKPQELKSVFDFKPQVIVNCAAWTNVDGAEDHPGEALSANREGARNVAQLAKELDIPLIHISTDYVFSGKSEQPWETTDEPHPTSKYGETKLLGEMVIQEVWSEKSFIMRTAWLYGPYGKNFAKTILKKAISTQDDLRVVNDQRGQPTATADLAKQILYLVLAEAPFGVYHATNSGDATWWEFAKEIVFLAGESTERVLPVTSQEFPLKVPKPSYSVLGHSGWSKVGLQPMRNWREALQEVFPTIRNAVEEELSNG